MFEIPVLVLNMKRFVIFTNRPFGIHALVLTPLTTDLWPDKQLPCPVRCPQLTLKDNTEQSFVELAEIVIFE